MKPLNSGIENSGGPEAANDAPLVRFRYNMFSAHTPNGEFRWRVIVETDGGFEEILVKRFVVNVPSFSTQDEMPVVGVKFHMACYGYLRIENDVAVVEAFSPP